MIRQLCSASRTRSSAHLGPIVGSGRECGIDSRSPTCSRPSNSPASIRPPGVNGGVFTRPCSQAIGFRCSFLSTGSIYQIRYVGNLRLSSPLTAGSVRAYRSLSTPAGPCLGPGPRLSLRCVHCRPWSQPPPRRFWESPRRSGSARTTSASRSTIRSPCRPGRAVHAWLSPVDPERETYGASTNRRTVSPRFGVQIGFTPVGSGSHRMKIRRGACSK